MPTQSPPVAYTLRIISASDLPERRFKRLGERNIIVKAIVDDCSVQTEVCTGSSSAEWKETFHIEARETSSILSLKLSGSTHGVTSLNCTSDITIIDLLQLCRAGKDAELNLRGLKSGFKGRITVHLSLTSSGNWIVDEAQRWALVLAQPPNIAAIGGCISAIDVPLAGTIMVSTPILNVLDKLENFMRIADEVAKVHPYAKLAWDVLSAAHKIIVTQVAIDQSVADLANTIQGIYSFVDALEVVPSKIVLLKDIIQRIFMQTVECGIFIREYSGHNFAGRILSENMGASTPVKVARMAQNLMTLRGEFDTGVAVQTTVVCFRIQTDVNTLLENHAFNLLESSAVALSSGLQCLPGTRRDIIHDILEWALHPSEGDNSNIYVLHGVAGIGKTAVAATVATHFSEIKHLGAFVGFERAATEQIKPYPVVKALAHQMALFDESLRASIVQVINDHTKAPILKEPLSEQFNRLIVKPLTSMPTLPGDGPIVIVLDGLYECGQPDDWANFLEVLFNQTEGLPSNLRFIITSRTANGIYDATTGTKLHPRIKCQELRSSSHADIYDYLRFRTQRIKHKKYLRDDWPGRAAIAKLTARAFGFYPWAVGASKFIDAFDPEDRLLLLLQPLGSISEPDPTLDTLYRAALNSAGDWGDDGFVKRFRTIMGAVIESPTTILSTVATNRRLMEMVQCLGTVMTREPVVRVLHPSFLDFLSSQERSGGGDWHFEHVPVRVSAGPATLCLEIMNAGLKRNICNMTLSSHLTTELLEEEMAYSCESWVDHLCTYEIFESQEIEKLTVVFLRTHLLHWFEVMSILKKSEKIVPMLQWVAT